MGILWHLHQPTCWCLLNWVRYPHQKREWNKSNRRTIVLRPVKQILCSEKHHQPLRFWLAKLLVGLLAEAPSRAAAVCGGLEILLPYRVPGDALMLCTVWHTLSKDPSAWFCVCLLLFSGVFFLGAGCVFSLNFSLLWQPLLVDNSCPKQRVTILWHGSAWATHLSSPKPLPIKVVPFWWTVSVASNAQPAWDGLHQLSLFAPARVVMIKHTMRCLPSNMVGYTKMCRCTQGWGSWRVLNFNFKSTFELREVPVQPHTNNFKETQPSQRAPGTEDSCSKSWANPTPRLGLLAMVPQ